MKKRKVKKMIHVTIYMWQEMWDEVQYYAGEEEITASLFVRKCLEDKLKRLEKK